MQAARGASLNHGDEHQTTASPKDRPNGRRVRLFAVVAVVGYVCDVTTKVAAVALLSDRPPVTVVPGVLDLTLVRNPGAAFGLATGLTVVLTVVALAVCLVVVTLARRLGDRVWAVALGLMLGGALGNLTDRFLREPGPFRGHVVDFLALPNWPVFNLADTSVCIAAGLIVLQSFRGVGLDGRRDGRKQRNASGDTE